MMVKVTETAKIPALQKLTYLYLIVSWCSDSKRFKIFSASHIVVVIQWRCIWKTTLHPFIKQDTSQSEMYHECSFAKLTLLFWWRTLGRKWVLCLCSVGGYLVSCGGEGLVWRLAIRVTRAADSAPLPTTLRPAGWCTTHKQPRLKWWAQHLALKFFSRAELLPSWASGLSGKSYRSGWFHTAADSC